MSQIFIGVEFGQRRSHSALCVATREFRHVAGFYESHFLVRVLERLDIGVTYPALGDRLRELEINAWKMVRNASLVLYVNVTGSGEALVEYLASRLETQVRPVYFSHGDQRSEDFSMVKLGKALLVSRLQMLLQTGRVHLPKTAQTRLLAEELLDYEITVAPDANERYGTFSVGTQDDLVMALGLALQTDNPRGSGGWVEASLSAWD